MTELGQIPQYDHYEGTVVRYERSALVINVPGHITSLCNRGIDFLPLITVKGNLTLHTEIIAFFKRAYFSYPVEFNAHSYFCGVSVHDSLQAGVCVSVCLGLWALCDFQECVYWSRTLGECVLDRAVRVLLDMTWQWSGKWNLHTIQMHNGTRALCVLACLQPSFLS